MPKKVFRIDRFDGGINTRDSSRDKVTTAVSNIDKEDKFTDIGKYRPSRNYTPPGISSPRDIAKATLIKAENVMVDAVGKIRMMGSIEDHVSNNNPPPTGNEIKAGRGLFFFRADHDLDKNAENESFLAFADPANSEIDIYEFNEDTWTTADTASFDLVSLGSGTALEAVYYYADGVLRIADATRANGNQPKWLGYINRTHFSGSAAEKSYTGWKTDGVQLTAPATVTNGTGSPTANTEVMFTINDTNSGDTDWLADTYEVKATFIYDGNQESLLSTDNATFTLSDSGLEIQPYIKLNGDFDPRKTGVRLYCRIDGSDDSWNLLLDISLRNGARNALTGEYNSWVHIADNVHTATAGYFTYINPETYESINGFDPNQERVSIGNTGDGYSYATVANRRAWIFAPTATNKDGNQVNMEDSILYSEVNKFDTFPDNNFVDVGINDGDEFIAGEAFGDRLLAFKNDMMVIINIQSGSDTGWFIEQKYPQMGISQPSAMMKTSRGIVWISKYGCYYYDGKQIHKLSEKIDNFEWYNNFYTENAQVAYNPYYNQVIVIDSNAGTGGDTDRFCYVYDFRTTSWTTGKNVFDDRKHTNFVIDSNQDLVWGQKSTDVAIKNWNNASSDHIPEIITKDYVFGTEYRVKKVYQVRLSVKEKGGSNETIAVSYRKNGSDGSWAEIDTKTISSNAEDLLIYEFTTPVECQSMQYKITTAADEGAAIGKIANIEIDSIEVVYRTLYKRAT